MKILYLSPSGALGGAERVLLSVLRGVRQASPDAQLHLLALSAGPLLEHAANLGVQVEVLPLPSALEALGDSQLANERGRTRKLLALLYGLGVGSVAGWRYLRRFRQYLAALRPNLIHSNGIKTHGLCWLAGSAGAPVVWHVHDFVSTRPLACRLLRRAARKVEAAIAVSAAVARDLHALGLHNRTRVIANAVDVHAFCPGPPDGGLLDRLAGLSPSPEGCLRIGLIATYARWKGHKVVLEAAAQVIQAAPTLPVRFYVVGGPIYRTLGSQFSRSELQAFAAQLGIAAQVGFIDFQADVASIYQALDVVVHASTAPEPFGLTIIEAMACAKPVIATLAGGVGDILQPGHDALAISPGDVNALAEAVRTLLRDADLRRWLGAQARQTITRKFNQERLGPQMMDVYRRVGWHGSPASLRVPRATSLINPSVKI